MELQRHLAAFGGHAGPVWDVAACPTGGYFASASRDCTARLWAIDQEDSLRLLPHPADVECVAWHPTGSYIATGASDRALRIWDWESAACCRVLIGLRTEPCAVAFSPDGTKVAAAGDDGQLVLWDLGSARRLATAAAHADAVHSLDFSVEGSLLATGGADCCVRIWDVATLAGVRTPPRRRLRHTPAAGCLGACAACPAAQRAAHVRAADNPGALAGGRSRRQGLNDRIATPGCVGCGLCAIARHRPRAD